MNNNPLGSGIRSGLEPILNKGETEKTEQQKKIEQRQSDIQYISNDNKIREANEGRNLFGVNVVYRGSDEQRLNSPVNLAALQTEQKREMAKGSITLDKDTGNIKVTAPSIANKNERFKDTLKGALDVISQNYKLNDKYKYELISGQGEKTSEEWVAEIQKDLPSMIANASAIETTKREAKAKDNVDLSDDDVIKMSTIALEYLDENGQTVKVKDDTRQALPTRIKNLNVFKNIKGWDENTHTVDYKNLMEAWNRGEVWENKPSDEDFLEVFNEVEDYFLEGDFSDPTEYAEMTALSKFINGKDPSSGFLQGVADIGGKLFMGIWSGAGEFDANVLNAVEGAFNAAGNFGTWAAGQVTGKDVSGRYDQMTWWRDNMMPELDTWKEKYQTNAMRLNDAAGTVYGISNAITPIVMQAVIGDAIAGAAISKIGGVAGRLIAQSKTGRTIVEGAKGIKNGVVTAEELANNVFTGTKFLLKLQSANKANKVVSAAITTVRKFNMVGKIVRPMADIAAQSVVDCVLTDSKLFRQFIEGDADDESKAYMLQQFADNFKGWAIGTSAMKGVSAASKTELGRVVNAWAAPRASLISAKIKQTADNIRTFFHHGDSDWLKNKVDELSDAVAKSDTGDFFSRRRNNKLRHLEQKYQAQTSSRFVSGEQIKGYEEVKDALRGAEDWDDLVKKADAARGTFASRIAKANRFIDSVYNSDVITSMEKLRIQYEDFSRAEDTYIEKLGKVLNAEDADAAFKSAKKRKLDKVEVGGGKQRVGSLRNETNQYVNALYRRNQAELAKASAMTSAEDLKGIEKELEHLNGIIENFENTYSDELITASNELYEQAKKLSAATQDVKVSEGVLSGEKLTKQRGSEYFKDGYMRQQRVSEWNAYQKATGLTEIRDVRGMQNIAWGSTDEYQDITMVLFDDINQTVKMKVRKEQVNMLKSLGHKVETVVSGDSVRIVENVSPLMSEAKSALKQNAKKAGEQIKDEYFRDMFHKKFSPESQIRKAEKRATRASGKWDAAEDKKYTSSLAERKRFAMSMDDNDVDDVLMTLENNPFEAVLETDDDFNMFLGGLDERTQNMIKARIRDGEGTLFEPRMSERQKLVAQFESNQKYDKKSVELFMRRNGALPKNGKIPSTGNKSYINNFVTTSGGKKMTSYDELQNLEDSWKVYSQQLKEADAAVPELYSLENYRKVLRNDPNLWDDMRRSYLVNSKNALDSEFIKDATEFAKRQKKISEAETVYKEDIEALNKLRAEYDLKGVEDGLNDILDESIDDYINVVRKDSVANEAISELMSNGELTDDAIEYYALRSLMQNKKAFKDSLKEEAGKAFKAELKAKGLTKNKELTDDVLRKYKGQASKFAANKLEQRYASVCGRLQEAGSDILDYKEYFGKVSKLNDDIRGAKQASNIVKTYADSGYEEYVELSPTIADLITKRPPALRQGAFGTIEQAFVKVFRKGTTGGLNPASLVRQAFKDTGMAVTMGDALKSTKQVKRILTEQFGDEIAERMSQEMPDVWETLLSKTGGNVEEATKLAVDREMSMGMANIGSELESNLYTASRRGAGVYGLKDQSTFDNIQDSINNFNKKTEFLNDMRETYLRDRVYSNNFLKGIREGMSMEQAREYAQFIQANATTNFTRATYHLTALADTVPYLRAAINGTSSFWRLLEFDPVGVTTRIVGGYVVPVIALTNLSLSDEENKRIYKQIPEYQKDSSLVFVVNGQIMSIPVPEEISNFVRPIQNMVESMQGGNSHMFNELMLNDMLGFAPINLEGFTNLDADRILSGNIIQNNLIPGVSKMVAGMMPPLVKSGFMAATGYDPYTMKYIDTSFNSVDEETGESVVMDYKSSEFAKLIAKVTGGKIPAPMAQAFLKNLIGESNIYAMDFLTDLGQSVVEQDLEGARDALLGEEGLLSDIAGGLTKPLYNPRYGELSNQAWNRAVNQLYREKDELLNDEEYINDLKNYASDTASEESKKASLSRIQTKREAYQKKVYEASKNLVKEYDGTFDRNKFMSVVSLMRFDNIGVDQDPDNPYSSYLSAQEKQVAKAKAIETMQKMGFDSPNDNSILGYYGKDYDGNVGIQFSSPLAILNFEKTQQMQDKMALATVRDIVTDSKLYDRHESVSNQIDTLWDKYNAKGVSSSKKKEIKNEISAIQINWNAEVFAELAPYVSQMTPEAAINNKGVLDYLYTYIEVPESYKTNDKGGYVNLGDDGNKKKAYIDSYIKRMFSVNDPYKGQY